MNVSCSHVEVGCKVTHSLLSYQLSIRELQGLCLAERERQLGSLYANSKVRC